MRNRQPYVATLADTNGRRVRVPIVARDSETANGEALAACAKRQRATGVEWRVMRLEAGAL